MSENRDQLDVSFTEDEPLKEQRFLINGKEHVLREPPEEAARRFRNNNLRGAKFVEGKFSANADNMASTQSELVGDCLFDAAVYGKDGGKPVGPLFVRTHMTARRVKGMFEWLKKVGGLEEGGDNIEAVDKQIERLQERREKLLGGGDIAKNSLSASMASSE